MMATRARFAEVVRSEPIDLGLACLLVGGEVQPDLDVDASLAALDALAASVRAPGPGPVAAADGLRAVLGGFAGGSYDDLRSSLLHEVLRRRCGLPLLLSIVWLEVALRRGIPAYAVGLPGHVVVGIGDPEDEHVLVDPYAGGAVVTPDQPDLTPMPADQLLLRLLTNVRALTTRQPLGLTATATRLWAVELSLLLPRHPLDLRRERGELLVRLGDHVGGAVELETYAAAVDSDSADAARRTARQARAQLN